MNRLWLVFVAAVSLAACNPVALVEDVGSEVEQFQTSWGKGDLDAIWRSADPELREVAGRERFNRMLTDFGALFGPLQSSERENLAINTNNGDTTATIVMRSQYANGEVLENFIFRQSGERMMLISYDAQSPLLDDYDFSQLEGEGLIYEEAPE